MKLLANLLLLAVSAAHCLGQTPADPAPQTPAAASPDTPTLTAKTILVRVPAMVRTKAGEPVFTLTADDFLVTDDGAPQKVTLEEDTGSQPLALVVVIQIGGLGAAHIEDARRLQTFVEAIVGSTRHKVAIVAFDSEPELFQVFTPNLDTIGSAAHALDAGDDGAAILDALGFSVDLLRKQPPEYRRAILLISETIDHGSHIRLDDALRSFGDTNTTIYSLAFNTSRAEARHESSRLFSGPPGPAHGCMAKDTELTADAPESRWARAYDCLSLLAPPLRLLKIATLVAMNNLRSNVPEAVAKQTGGEYAKFNDAKGLERGLFALSNHLPNQYILSFHPQAPHPGLHTIGLELKNYSNLSVTARTTYWADGDTGTAPAP